jgi:hypothetical protein
MKTIVALGFVALACQPATAITCEEVRHYVETYGAAMVLTYAKKVGATPQQIREGRACLRYTAKREQARTGARDEIVER